MYVNVLNQFINRHDQNYINMNIVNRPVHRKVEWGFNLLDRRSQILGVQPLAAVAYLTKGNPKILKIHY